MAQNILSPEERKKRYEEFKRRQAEAENVQQVNTNNDEAQRLERKKEVQRKKEELKKRQKEEEKIKKRRKSVLFVMAEMVLCLVLSITCYGFSVLNAYSYVELDPTIYKETTGSKDPASIATETSYVDVTNDSGEVIERSVVDVTVPEEARATGFRNILILGLDKGENGNRFGYDDDGRNSDVIMIASINNDTGEIRLASVMRDMILRLEDGTSKQPYGKANDQFAQSGLSDTVSMINRNFGLDIDEYITINWYAVANVINQMGGVELTIPNETVLSYFNGYLTEVNETTGIWAPQLQEPGTYLMSGTQAVAFCRIRYGGYNDDGRTEHQREVIAKLFEKAKSMAKNGEIGLLLNIAKEALGTVQTNLKLPDIFRMISELNSYNMGGSTKVPASYETDKYVGNYFVKYHILDPVVATDFQSEVVNLHKFLFNEDYVPSDFIRNIHEQMYNDRKGIN